MQIRQIVPNGDTWDIKTSNPATLRVSNTDATVCQLQQKMTLSWQQVLSHKYKYQYQYQQSKYQYKYQYPKIVLKYRSSTSTSTQYNKTATRWWRNRFDTIPARDGWTDRRTDGQTRCDRYYAL